MKVKVLSEVHPHPKIHVQMAVILRKLVDHRNTSVPIYNIDIGEESDIQKLEANGIKMEKID